MQVLLQYSDKFPALFSGGNRGGIVVENMGAQSSSVMTEPVASGSTGGYATCDYQLGGPVASDSRLSRTVWRDSNFGHDGASDPNADGYDIPPTDGELSIMYSLISLYLYQGSCTVLYNPMESHMH